MKKKDLHFAPVEEGAVTGPQAFQLAAVYGLNPLEAGLRLRWARKDLGLVINFDKERDVEWLSETDWWVVMGHFTRHLGEPCPPVSELWK